MADLIECCIVGTRPSWHQRRAGHIFDSMLFVNLSKADMEARIARLPDGQSLYTREQCPALWDNHERDRDATVDLPPTNGLYARRHPRYVVQALSNADGWRDSRRAAETIAAAEAAGQQLQADDSSWMPGDYPRQVRIAWTRYKP